MCSIAVELTGERSGRVSDPSQREVYSKKRDQRGLDNAFCALVTRRLSDLFAAV